MDLQPTTLVNPKRVKVVAAIIIGLSIGSLVPPNPVLLPAIGIVPGLIVGSLGLLVGAGLYILAPQWVTPSGCDCSGDCGCS